MKNKKKPWKNHEGLSESGYYFIRCNVISDLIMNNKVTKDMHRHILEIQDKILWESLKFKYGINKDIIVSFDEYMTWNYHYEQKELCQLQFSGLIKDLIIDEDAEEIRFRIMQDNEYSKTETIMKRFRERAVRNYQKHQRKDTKQKRNTEGYVYLIHTTLGIKIGLSSKYKERIADITAKLPIESRYITVYKVKDRFEAEKRLHREFTDINIRGEWFKLEEEDVLKACEILEIEFKGEEVEETLDII